MNCDPFFLAMMMMMPKAEFHVQGNYYYYDVPTTTLDNVDTHESCIIDRHSHRHIYIDKIEDLCKIQIIPIRINYSQLTFIRFANFPIGHNSYNPLVLYLVYLAHWGHSNLITRTFSMYVNWQ